MFNKASQFAYGIKLIATWMLIPFVLMFIPILCKEFRYQMTACEVTLMKETYSAYPDEYSSFETEINGRERVVQAPVTSKEGDKITVILRNGEYYLTPQDSGTMDSYMTFGGRFIRVTNNNLGYHVIGLSIALVLSFLFTFKNRRAIRKTYPLLSKVTDIAGITVSVIMSAVLVYAAIDGTLTSLSFAYLSLMLGIAYTAIFVLAWIVDCVMKNKKA